MRKNISFLTLRKKETRGLNRYYTRGPVLRRTRTVTSDPVIPVPPLLLLLPTHQVSRLRPSVVGTPVEGTMGGELGSEGSKDRTLGSRLRLTRSSSLRVRVELKDPKFD